MNPANRAYDSRLMFLAGFGEGESVADPPQVDQKPDTWSNPWTYVALGLTGLACVAVFYLATDPDPLDRDPIWRGRRKGRWFPKY